jgi:hypothetical protein
MNKLNPFFYAYLNDERYSRDIKGHIKHMHNDNMRDK